MENSFFFLDYCCFLKTGTHAAWVVVVVHGGGGGGVVPRHRPRVGFMIKLFPGKPRLKMTPMDTPPPRRGWGDWSLCPAILFISQGRWKALFFHLRIGSVSIMPCGHLFISPFPPQTYLFPPPKKAPPPIILMVPP